MQPQALANEKEIVPEFIIVVIVREGPEVMLGYKFIVSPSI